MNLDELEKLGEQEVRKRLASNVYGDSRNPNNVSVQTWLRSKELESEETRSAEAMTLAREANSVAREANDLARSSNSIACEAKEFARSASDSASKQARWAMWAAIIATMAYIKNP